MPKGVHSRPEKVKAPVVCRDCGKRPAKIYKDLCTVCYKREWNKNNPEKAKASRSRNYIKSKKRQRERQLKNGYGLTLDQYEDMVVSQLGLCAICQNPPGVKSLSVDHCHRTGKVRGLLCSLCNQGIGCLRDSAELLVRAAQYLNK